MEELFYNMIFKRKSFHIFKGIQKLDNDEINDIKKYIDSIIPLNSNIKTSYQIVDRKLTSCPRGEYCILLYSEEKEDYLQNIGYIGEQIDLYLTSKNIGVCWYGLGKTDLLEYNNLKFIMMLTIEKADVMEFRKDMYKSKRKNLNEIWFGDYYLDIANIVRFAPSSCNTQPWIVKSDLNKLQIYRYKKPGKRGMMPINRVTFSNRIDMGIFYLFIELCLKHNNITFKRTIYDDLGKENEEMTLSATYDLNEE